MNPVKSAKHARDARHARAASLQAVSPVKNSITVTVIVIVTAEMMEVFNMIISGNVQTLMGPVPVKNIKAGDMVIGTNHVPCEVKAVNSEEVSKALVFAWNPALRISEGSRVQTVYGMKEADGTLLMKATNGADIPETVKEEDGTFMAYELVVQNCKSVMVSGYGVEVTPC